MRPRRQSPLTALDSYSSRRKSSAIVLFCLLFAWILWSRLLRDRNETPPVSYAAANRYPVEQQPVGIYEAWLTGNDEDNGAEDFSASAEYRAFVASQSNGPTHPSDAIPIERTVPDTRHILCRIRKYPPPTSADRFSIIIVVHRAEAASVLVRTIVSVLRRTPAQLLGELILLLDGQQPPETSTPPPLFNATFLQLLHHKIRLHRSVEPMGLGRSRQFAAMQLAQHPFLLFLDAHSEVNVGWLPPLLGRLLAAQTTGGAVLVSPALDVLDGRTWEYRAGAHWMRAGFDWAMRPRWFEKQGAGWAEDEVHEPKEEEEEETGVSAWNETLPFLSPTTAGGTFAVSREWFARVGGFDGVLASSGGSESLELSLRAWMCGGHVEIAPCSRVGHQFGGAADADGASPAVGWNSANINREDRERNAQRIAETWLGPYRPLFYENRFGATQLGERISRRAWHEFNQPQCRAFRWYLETVFPELGKRSVQFAALGELQQAGQCARATTTGQVELVDCVEPNSWADTTWALRRGGHLTLYNQTERCLNAFGATHDRSNGTMAAVRLEGACGVANSSRWTHNVRNNTLTETRSGLCLDVEEADGGVGQRRLGLRVCQLRLRRTQIWRFTVKTDQ